MRVAGATYQQVQEAGGGIASTVHATRNATDEVLRALARKRLDRFLRYGVTTVEAKSGYGLSLEQELRLLEVYRDVSYLHPVDVVPTLLAAHVVPVEYADRADDYVKLIVKKMIPAVAKKKLARFCDAFCEQGRLHRRPVPARAGGRPGERTAAETARRSAHLHGRHRDGGGTGRGVGGPSRPRERRAASRR